MSSTHEHPYGSARPATLAEISRAGLFKKGGQPFGFYSGRELFHHNMAGMAIYGGAGSGKSTTALAPMIMSGAASVFALDVKGELLSITLDGFVHLGIPVYILNPYRLHGIPGHTVSLLSHLVPNSQTLVGDSRRMWNALLPDSSGSNNRFFDEKGRFWGDAITRGLVHEVGYVSFPMLFDIVNMIRSDWDAWLDRAANIAAHSPPDVEAALLEMIKMNTGEARTYDSVMSGITNALAFMADPALRATFVDDHHADFSFDVFTQHSGPPPVVFLVMPPELLTPNAAIVRQCFSTLRTVKQRAPHARPVYPILDEAAALEQFPEIAEFFSIGRGFNFCPIVCYQDIGQVQRNLGQSGAMTLSANAAIELYLGGGIRDYQTAKLLSDRLGYQTIATDEKLVQERARKATRLALHRAIFEGADPFQMGIELQQNRFEAQHTRKQRRALMEPDEILALGADKTLTLAGGYQLMPFLADKIPYYQRRTLAGRFFPNPYVQRDMHSISVPPMFGPRPRRIIEAPLPSRFAHLPQYATGYPFRYIDGFKPRH